ncbi:MAG: helix-turn-helix transcriptional regulator [Candidatus Omnitrophica bacterium]|nr:helix-turn-helix transcriptional regulator [Candidatus Omnitrophota bacterium]MBU4468663.1 helix-turn-helix transcriptional regulator [Candidatus Omnitrophota bacterium]
METELRLKLATRIRELRKKHKYTQSELSELSDIDDKHIQLLESKKRCDVKLSTLAKLAKAFNITVSQLLHFK